MFDSPAISVIIGIVFIYLLYSLLASLIGEIVSTNLNLRSKVLEKAIQRMLNDDKEHHFWSNFKMQLVDRFKKIANRIQHLLPFWEKFILEKEKTLAGKFYEQPLIKYLGVTKRSKMPPYLGKENFSKNLFDMLKDMGAEVLQNENATIPEKIKAALGIGHPEGKAHPSIEKETLKYLRSLMEDANNDLEKFRAYSEKWFDDTMQRAGGWYKKYIQIILFSIGLVLALTFNVDTVEIITRLSKDDKARDQMVAMASDYVKKHNITKTKTGKDSVIVDASTYTKRMDSLTKVVDSLLAKDIKNANGLLAIGWDTPLNFNSCDSLYVEKNDTPHKKSCRECLIAVHKKNQSCSEHVSRTQRFFYLACIILKDPMKMFGFLISALAISLGAPFWFDLLKKLMEMRGDGKKPENNTPPPADNDPVPPEKRVG